MYVEFILCHANCNDNQDEFTSEDLEANYSTAINKPINWQHSNHNIGVIYDSKFIKVSELVEADKHNYKDFDDLKVDFVICTTAIWEYKNPIEARKMRERNEQGTLFFSMENRFSQASCSECKESFESSFDYCDHLLTRHQTKASSRVLGGSNFVGVGVVLIPGDKGAKTLALAQKGQRGSIFYQVFEAKAMKNIHINDIIPYIITREGNMKIRKIDIPDKFSLAEDFDEYSDEFFADSTNRIFLLDNEENLSVSLKLALNDELNFYNKKEKLFVIENLVAEAKKYELNIDDYVKKDITGGNNEMTIDKNSAEFKQAVAKQLEEEISKLDSKAQTDELENEISSAKKDKEELDKKLKKADEDKAKAEKELENYKQAVAQEKVLTERMSSLTEKGFAFEDNADFVKASISLMKDETFDSFVSTLEEVEEIVKAVFKKKEEEEDKDKKKKKKIDPVKASQDVAIASKVDNDGENEEKYSAIDAVLSQGVNL